MKTRFVSLFCAALLLTLCSCAQPQLDSGTVDTGPGTLSAGNPESSANTGDTDRNEQNSLPNGEIREKLKLVAESEAATQLWDGATKMTEDEVMTAAREILDRMVTDKLIPAPSKAAGSSPYETEYVEPRITVPKEENGPSLILWVYTCDGLPGGMVHIDDETGQMVRICLWTDAAPETYASLAADWRSFLSAYYGVDLELDYNGELFQPDGTYITHYSLLLDMGEQQEPCRLNLKIHDVMAAAVSFNSSYLPGNSDAVSMP